MSTITWLHLSDLHFKADKQYKENSKVVLEGLLGDIQVEMLEKRKLIPDLIMVTGDIANSGTQEEYILAEEFFNKLLSKIGLQKEQLLIVPGNHDVVRSEISYGVKTIISSLDIQGNVYDLFSDSEDRKFILRKLKNYINFVRNYTGDSMHLNDENYYCFVRNLKDKNIVIIGLNSAWASGDNDEVEGKILLGEMQVRRAIEKFSKVDLYIIMMHHPIECLKGFDMDSCKKLLWEKNALVLRGHKHEQALEKSEVPNGYFLTIAAGSAYESINKHNGYNFVKINLESNSGINSGIIYPRIWSGNVTGNWVDDILSISKLQEGGYKFNLSRRLSLESRESKEEKTLPKTADQNHEESWEHRYALEKIQKNLMPSDVLEDLQEHKIREVIIEMEKIYKTKNPKLHAQFLKELLNG